MPILSLKHTEVVKIIAALAVAGDAELSGVIAEKYQKAKAAKPGPKSRFKNDEDKAEHKRRYMVEYHARKRREKSEN